MFKQQKCLYHNSRSWKCKSSLSLVWVLVGAASLACRQSPSHCISYHLFSVWAHFYLGCPFLNLAKALILLDEDPILVTKFSLNYLLNILYPNIVTLVVMTSAKESGWKGMQCNLYSLMLKVCSRYQLIEFLRHSHTCILGFYLKGTADSFLQEECSKFTKQQELCKWLAYGIR